jgi:1-acyl-sn-glycerol-3-phosphate acyltransferase
MNNNHQMRTERSLAWRLSQILAHVLTTQLFELHVSGLENIPATGGALIVSNHQSNLDPVLLAVRLKRPVNYIAKSELFQSRIGRRLLRNVFNAFPVRQGTGDIGAVKETIQRLREGHLLNLYPEGGRTEDGEIGPMLRGVGLIVRRAGVPVVPVVIEGSFEAWPQHRRCFRPHPIRVRYGTPMELNGMSEDEIVATIDQTLRQMFTALRAAPPSSHDGRQPAPAGALASFCATSTTVNQRQLR